RAGQRRHGDVTGRCRGERVGRSGGGLVRVSGAGRVRGPAGRRRRGGGDLRRATRPRPDCLIEPLFGYAALHRYDAVARFSTGGDLADQALSVAPTSVDDVPESPTIDGKNHGCTK